MKKLLATGLIASVAMASTESSAACGNGGFYVGANFGVAFSKAKATNEKKTDYQEGDAYGAEASGFEICAAGAMDEDEKLMDQDVAKKRSELAVDAMKNNKKKAKSLAEFVLGYDFRLNNVMIGVELNAGGIFGANKLNRSKLELGEADAHAVAITEHTHPRARTVDAGEYAKVKEQWHIALMPRVGYLFTPQFEGYVTFGVKLAKFKTEVNDIPFVTEDTYVFADDAILNNKLEMKSMSKKSTKAVFVAGAGVRYEFNPSFFAKLEYNFEFGAKPKLHKEAMPEVKKIKVTTHTVKLGLGYRF